MVWFRGIITLWTKVRCFTCAISFILLFKITRIYVKIYKVISLKVLILRINILNTFKWIILKLFKNDLQSQLACILQLKVYNSIPEFFVSRASLSFSPSCCQCILTKFCSTRERAGDRALASLHPWSQIHSRLPSSSTHTIGPPVVISLKNITKSKQINKQLQYERQLLSTTMKNMEHSELKM